MSSIARSRHPRPLTYQDLDDTPEDGNLYEVIDGELYVTPFPGYAHQTALTELVAIIRQHVKSHKLGRVFTSGLKVVLDTPTGVGPDIVYISAARMNQMQKDGYYGAPDLVVEILSSKPGLDRHVKFNKYAQSGIPEYWIVDPKERSLNTYRLEGGHYRLHTELEGDAVFSAALFPGLEINLSELWI